ncbi:hypothetical protein EV363DRAFT_843847 [Boletus edulis]|nr:hypothetical protein EV363DRAFT_843847 [Boletus edulis]
MLYIMLILEGVFGFISVLSIALSSLEESKYVVPFWSFPVWLGLSILVDISIAGSVCYILKKDGPFISMRLNFIDFKVIMLLTINTSLVTGITAALWTVAQLDPTHLLMGFPVGGIYAICFMANLIARESYFYDAQANDGDECFEIATATIVFATPGDVEKSGEIP